MITCCCHVSCPSHLITVPAGVLPQDAITASPLIHGNGTYGGGSLNDAGAGGAANAGGGGGGGGFEVHNNITFIKVLLVM